MSNPVPLSRPGPFGRALCAAAMLLVAAACAEMATPPVAQEQPAPSEAAEATYERGQRAKAEGDAAGAAALFETAAEAGHPGAAFELGEAYTAGRGVPKDLDLAAQWIDRAARGGDSRRKAVAFEAEWCHAPEVTCFPNLRTGQFKGGGSSLSSVILHSAEVWTDAGRPLFVTDSPEECHCDYETVSLTHTAFGPGLAAGTQGSGHCEVPWRYRAIFAILPRPWKS